MANPYQTPSAGSSLLATWLAGALYARALARHGGGGGACRGPDCFRATFLLLAGLAAAALVIAVVLWHRTRPLYAKVIAWTKTERGKRGLKARRSLSFWRDGWDQPQGWSR